MIMHKIDKIEFDGTIMKLNIDEKEYKIDLKNQSKKLAEADNKIKMNYIISPSGYGIRWPEIDEDLSIDGLLGIRHKLPKKVHEHRKAS